MKKKYQDNKIKAIKDTLSEVLSLSNHDIYSIDSIGGMTNKNFKVNIKNENYILRIPGNGTEEMISRNSEKYNNLIVNKLEIDTDMLYFNEENGLKISKYINNAETITHKTAKREDNMKLITNILKKLHNSNIKFNNAFDVFRKIEEYEILLKKYNGKNFDDYTLVKDKVTKLEQILEQIGVESVPCHNDTVPENFVKDNGRVYLVDWEYSGMNDPMWDLAAHSLECDFLEGEEELFLSLYFEGRIEDRYKKKILIYKICQDFLWSIWTNVKEAKGDNFGTYGEDRYNRAKINLKKITN